MKIRQIAYSSSIQEIAYVSVLIAIAFVYLIDGMGTIHTTGLSNSVPPLVISLFKHCLCILTIYSTTRVLVVPSRSEKSAADIDNLVISVLELFHLVFVLFLYSVDTIYIFFPKSIYIYLIACSLYLIYPILFPSHYSYLFSRVIVSPSLRGCVTWLRIYMLYHGKTFFFLPLVNAAAREQKKENSIFSRNKKTVRMIKFVVGMTGAILFQNYFKLNSFREVLAFIYIALAWLATIALLSVPDDLGVFNFILGNVVIGSTVGESGLRAHTWLAYAASLLLYRLRLELETVSFIEGRLDSRGVIVFYLLYIIFLFGVCILGYNELTYSPPLFHRITRKVHVLRTLAHYKVL